jgi:hypothetical protein
MQLLCKPRAAPLFDREPHRFSVPANFNCAAARTGGQEPALRLRSERRPQGRRAPAPLALDGRDHCIATTFHQLSE